MTSIFSAWRVFYDMLLLNVPVRDGECTVGSREAWWICALQELHLPHQLQLQNELSAPWLDGIWSTAHGSATTSAQRWRMSLSVVLKVNLWHSGEELDECNDTEGLDLSLFTSPHLLSPWAEGVKGHKLDVKWPLIKKSNKSPKRNDGWPRNP